MKRHVVNSVYGLLDYGSYPFGMLLVAPIVLRRLGAAEYGVWMVSTAVVSAGGIIASGFCDANIQRVAKLRGTGAIDAMVAAVRSMMGINLVLGLVLAMGAWMAAPYAAVRITGASSITPVHECIVCLRLASGLILVRAMESVSVSTQRAFEQYRDAVRVSVAVRLLTLAAAAVLVICHQGTVAILVATTVFLLGGTWLQFRQLLGLFGGRALWPSFHAEETRSLLASGVFAWAQALGSVVFGQLDRVLLGVSLGAAALAPYALCLQFAQPVFGMTASGLHFLFPYFAGRAAKASREEMRSVVLRSVFCNLVLVTLGAGTLLLFGPMLISVWAGAAVARTAAAILPRIVVASALMGLGVTGTYALQAIGQFRTVACITLGGRAAVLLLMLYLLRHRGVDGLAVARVCYGAVALLVYLPLAHALRAEPGGSRTPLPLQRELQGGSTR